MSLTTGITSATRRMQSSLAPVSGGSVAGPVVLGVLSTVVSGLLFHFLGPKMATVALGVMIIVMLLVWISLKDLTYSLAFWMFTMAGFRTYGMVRMPGLPDLSIDRILLVWIVLLLLLRMLVKGRQFRGPYTADFLLLTYTIYVLVQLKLTGSPSFHEWVLSCLSPYFAFVYGRAVIKRSEEIRNILIFLFAMSVYFYIQSIAQRFGWHQLIWPKAILNPDVGALFHVGRSRGPVMHPPLFGQLQGMFLIVQLYFLIKVKNPLWRGVILVSIGLGAIGLLFSYTRGPWVATAAGIAVLGILRPTYRKALVVLLIIAVLAGSVGAIQALNTDFLQERLENTQTIENRLAFMASALRMSADHPLFGVGYFKFNEYRGHYNQGTYIPFYGFVRKKLGAEVAIHDIYIGRLAEEGAVSVMLLLALAVSVGRAFLAQWRASSREKYFDRDVLAMIMALAVCYLVGGMIIDFRYFDLVNVVFYFLAGLVYGYRARDAISDSRTSECC
ncbi:MAG: O-antigen ligase family protein [bacterium]|nr:O-antigen ligase family protein [bacterium]